MVEPVRADALRIGRQTDRMPKLLVPFQFTQEKSALDYLTGLNRYQFLRHLSAFADVGNVGFF